MRHKASSFRKVKISEVVAQYEGVLTHKPVHDCTYRTSCTSGVHGSSGELIVSTAPIFWLYRTTDWGHFTSIVDPPFASLLLDGWITVGGSNDDDFAVLPS